MTCGTRAHKRPVPGAQHPYLARPLRARDRSHGGNPLQHVRGAYTTRWDMETLRLLAIIHGAGQNSSAARGRLTTPGGMEIGHTRLLRMDPLHPDPGDRCAPAGMVDRKCAAIIAERCLRKR